MQFWTLDEIEDQVHVEHAADEEIAPGVVVSRRAILRLGLSAAGLALMGPLAGCMAPSRPEGRLRSLDSEGSSIGVDAFLSQVISRARALTSAPDPDEEAYLAAVSTLLGRLEAPSPWRPSPVRDGRSMDSIAYYPPVVLTTIVMSPNAKIELHDHRHYNGVLLATKGAARIRNFDIVQPDGRILDVAAGEVPSQDEDFLIRQNRDVVLRPRQLSTLTRDRDNIHHVEAGEEGATLIDLFTHFSPKARSYGLEWDDQPYDASNKLYKVSWKSG